MVINSILTNNDAKKSFDHEKEKIIKVIDKISSNHTFAIVTITSESVSHKDLTSKSRESFDVFKAGFMDLKIEKSNSQIAASMIQRGLDFVLDIVSKKNSSKVIFLNIIHVI